MASYYFDTSTFVKLYIEEEGTAELLNLIDEMEGDLLIVLDLALLESRSAIRRREREGDISRLDAERVLRRIEDDTSSSFLVQPSGSSVNEEAARLLDSHLLRTNDALQLGGCLVVRHGVPPPLLFVCADARLCEAASLEGLDVLNPLESQSS